ncbi:MAG: PAS domain S-box protein, partial [Ferruginibacter sp.]
KYRSLIEHSKDGLAIILNNPTRVDILAGKNILGYSNDDYNNYLPESYIHPDDVELINSAFMDIINDPSKSESREYRAYKKEVGYIWIESTFHNMLNVPSVNGIVANFRDINDRKISEELLRLSEEKYRVLFNENPLALIIWDPQTYIILEVNEMACKEYGYSRKEFIGLNTKKIILPELVPRFLNYALGLFNKSAGPISYSSTNIKKDGGLIYIDITFQPFNYFGVNASVAMIKNINEQVKLERELSEERNENQKQITEAVLKAQEQERAHIGRELHDNINQILATSRLYIEYAQKTPDMHDMLLFKARDFILTAIQEIRSLSKSVLPPSISDVGLAASLDDLLGTMREINHFKFITSYKIDEELLSPNLKLAVFRIVQEQLNNIIRHAKAKNVSIKIKSAGNKIILLIQDDGVGFETGKKSNGVGLKNIESRAALFNGTINIDSTPGNGTVLKVDFYLEQ